MANTPTFTLTEASLQFAQKLNTQVWELLQQPQRTRVEDEMMVHMAHASCYHWLRSGTGMHHQRAEWLLAHVYTILGAPDLAIKYATRCLELTNEYSDLMKDFDHAYAFEGMARAFALAGKTSEGQKYLALAEEAGHAIKDREDLRIFSEDFNSGDWFGLR
jgi:hypothetical protein